MTLARTILMGNGRWLSFVCPECDHHNAVSAPNGTNLERVEGFTPCLWCGERVVVDLHPKER